MPVPHEDPVTDEEGQERHPAFGMARVSRVSATPGKVLFQSELRHREYIEVTLSEAARQRDLNRDWVYAEQVLVKFSMSMAQFASLVASGGTEGVPVTIEYDHGARPGLTMESRLALTAAEAQSAAHDAFRHIEEAEAAYEAALAAKEPAGKRRQLLADLRAAIRNAAPNVDYAARQLAEHAENVVETSRADIEAMAGLAAQRQQALADPRSRNRREAGPAEPLEAG